MHLSRRMENRNRFFVRANMLQGCARTPDSVGDSALFRTASLRENGRCLMIKISAYSVKFFLRTFVRGLENEAASHQRTFRAGYGAGGCLRGPERSVSLCAVKTIRSADMKRLPPEISSFPRHTTPSRSKSIPAIGGAGFRGSRRWRGFPNRRPRRRRRRSARRRAP